MLSKVSFPISWALQPHLKHIQHRGEKSDICECRKPSKLLHVHAQRKRSSVRRNESPTSVTPVLRSFFSVDFLKTSGFNSMETTVCILENSCAFIYLVIFTCCPNSQDTATVPEASGKPSTRLPPDGHVDPTNPSKYP